MGALDDRSSPFRNKDLSQRGWQREELPRALCPHRAGPGEQTWPLVASFWAWAEGRILGPLSTWAKLLVCGDCPDLVSIPFSFSSFTVTGCVEKPVIAHLILIK